MQELEREQVEQALPTSQPVTLAALGEPIEQDDDPDEIFLNAVAEIDTQPLVPVKRNRAATTLTIGDVLEMLYLVGWACFVLVGSIYLAATVPHTRVIIYARTYPATLTAPIDLPTRTREPSRPSRSRAHKPHPPPDTATRVREQRRDCSPCTTGVLRRRLSRSERC